MVLPSATAGDGGRVSLVMAAEVGPPLPGGRGAPWGGGRIKGKGAGGGGGGGGAGDATGEGGVR